MAGGVHGCDGERVRAVAEEEAEPRTWFEREQIVVLREAKAGSLAQYKAPSPPRLRPGARRGDPRLQVGRGGRWVGALMEARRHIQPAGEVVCSCIV